MSIRQDLEDRWVTNLNEDRKIFYLITTLFDPRTKSLTFCDDKHFPKLWKHEEGNGFLARTLSKTLKAFTVGFSGRRSSSGCISPST
jgi:hypothetical protein